MKKPDRPAAVPTIDAQSAAKGPPTTDASVQESPGDAPVYAVSYLPGGIDRVILTKRDDSRRLCVQVMLLSPMALDSRTWAGSVAVPPSWELAHAFALRNSTNCGAPMRRRPPGALDANEVTGSIRWGRSPTEGTAVELRLSFPARDSEPAFTERMSFTR